MTSTPGMAWALDQQKQLQQLMQLQNLQQQQEAAQHEAQQPPTKKRSGAGKTKTAAGPSAAQLPTSNTDVAQLLASLQSSNAIAAASSSSASASVPVTETALVPMRGGGGDACGSVCSEAPLIRLTTPGVKIEELDDVTNAADRRPILKKLSDRITAPTMRKLNPQYKQRILTVVNPTQFNTYVVKDFQDDLEWMSMKLIIYISERHHPRFSSCRGFH